MLDELRSHDPKPTEQERAWIEANPLRIVARVMALTVLALIIATALTNFSTAKAPAGVTVKAPAAVVAAR